MNAKPVLFTNANLIDGSGIPLSTEPFSVLVSGNIIETVARTISIYYSGGSGYH